MDKYIESLNTISNYEVWHECTYDDGYSNFDDWTEYPFGDSEEVNLLSELITKHDTLNKGIDELIKKYEEEKELIWHDIMCNKKDTPTYNRLSGELTQVNQMLEDLKKLKGE